MGGTAAVVSAIVSVVSAGGAVYSSMEKAKDRDRARDQLDKERKQATKLHKDRTKRLMSAQKAAFGASGVRVGEGTPLEVIESTRSEAAKERDAIKKGYKYKSDVLSREADRLRLGGALSAGGSLLSGGAKYAADPYAPWNPFEGKSSKGREPYIPGL